MEMAYLIRKLAFRIQGFIKTQIPTPVEYLTIFYNG